MSRKNYPVSRETRMLSIPSHLRMQFQQSLKDRAIPNHSHGSYLKWLRYDLDVCQTYHFPHEHKESLPHFLKKLQQKRQTETQRAQAMHAIGLYYELLASVPTPHPTQEGKPTPGPLRQPFDLAQDRTQDRLSQEGKPTPHPSQEGNVTDAVQKRNTLTIDHCQLSIVNSEALSQEGNELAKVPDTLTQETLSASRDQRRAASRPIITVQGASWKAEYTRLTETLQRRQYDPKTAKAYTKWVRKFQAFTRSKPPAMLSSEDARAFLASLQKKGKMSVSKLNQACDALLLLYTHVLEKPCEIVRVTRQPAAQPPRTGRGASWQAELTQLKHGIQIRRYSPRTLKTYTHWVQKFQAFTRSKPPESLSPEDVKAFLTYLAVTRKVAASTQNQAFNALLFFFRHVLKQEFGEMQGVVRAKRKPSIPVVLSRAEIDAILQHLESLNILHQHDLDKGYAGVFLVHALEHNYPNAAREFIWQGFFPAIALTYLEHTREYRRYHLHESHVRKAIQELLGHGDLRTTMIYTHTVKSTTKKEAKSPLDL